MVISAPNPPKLLVLPKDRSPEARVCVFTHPRTSRPSRYYFDQDKGVYELTKICATKSVPQSWLIGERADPVHGPNLVGRDAVATTSANDDRDVVADPRTSVPPGNDTAKSKLISAGFIMKDAELLVATPIDYLFLVLPFFAHTSPAKSNSSNGLFLSVDDLLEKLFEGSEHFEWLSSNASVRLAIEERLRKVCDTVDAGEEKMYRLNDGRLLDELAMKAKNMVAMGLPVSMEERFTRKALELPIMVVKHNTPLDSKAPQNDLTRSGSASSDLTEAQASTITTHWKASTMSVDTEMTIPDDSHLTQGDSELYHLLRLRTALSYIISAYLPSNFAARVQSLLASEESPVNFKLLDERLASVAQVRATALAARSLGDFSRKRSIYEEDDTIESKAEKRRRKEEEEKKKMAGESRGIRDLKKVDTKGMKKMSEFFGKGVMAKRK